MVSRIDSNKGSISHGRDGTGTDREVFVIPRSRILKYSFKTPVMVRWLIGISVSLITALFVLEGMLPIEGAGIYLLVASLSIFVITSVGLFALAKVTIQARHLKELLNIDRATGLFGSGYLAEELDRLVEEGDKGLFLIFLDLDELKSFNDRFGHRRGDALIHDAAEALSEAVAGRGVGFRYGGDEFVAILSDMSRSDAVALAKRVHKLFVVRKIAASIGMCQWRPGMSADDLLHTADKAMYKAKHAGKGRLFIPKEDCMNTDDPKGEFIDYRGAA